MRCLLKSHPRISSILIASVAFSTLLVATRSAYGSCTNPANAIEAENCQPGSPASEWDIDGAGDLSIQGFATDISVNVGGTVYFKIDTDASKYTIDIYRIGYYGGMGARHIASVTPSAILPQFQPACMVNSTVGLTDCGNWSVSASWNIPSNATTGIYFAHLVRTDTGGDSHIVFVVRNDASHSDILVQTSDETWQAYNYYGSGSVYGPNSSLFDLTNRSYKVSYNRPFLTRGFGPESATWVFGAEYALIEWLEANGFDVAYFTGMDAERYGSLIQNHKVYVSSGHDEYVSGAQRTNIQAARDTGVNLAFLSGNEVFWKTRWENSIDGTNTPYRTLVCYKETLSPNSIPTATAAVDPMDPPTWTGTWRDPAKSPPADGGRPENALTGTIFMVNGPGTDNDGSLAIKVPAADGQMRFWRNTAVASLPANGTYTLPEGTLGYEWDEDLDNGSRPPGAFELSTATYGLTSDLLLDAGGTYGAGTATHHLMMYRAPSGALVFGSGTIQWSWGLNSQHDNPFGFDNPNPDVNMEQATINLFADMGVQPATIQAGLHAATQSTDTIAPISTISSLASGANIATGAPITISGTATDLGGGVVAGVEVSTDGGQTWHPATGRASWMYSWVPQTVGTIALMSRAVDDSGNLENPVTSGGNPSGGVQINVNPQVCPCTIWNPAIGPTTADSGDTNSIEVGVQFRSDNDGVITGLRFYKASTNTGTHVGHLWTSSGALLGTVTFTAESGSGWQEVQFASPIPITANTVYVASYFAPSGHYSADSTYFSTVGYDDAPLHALANGVAGGDGVYIYSATPGVFPTTNFNATNYWVDVVLVSGSTFDISGNIGGLGGVGATVSLSGSANAVTTTDSSGDFQFAGLVNGTYTITPSNPGVTFTPPSSTVTINNLSVSNVNFGSVVTSPLSISGTITNGGGLGTSVTLVGPATLSVSADSSGNYSFNGLIRGSYTVIPSEAGYIFLPGSQAVSLTNASVTGVNFMGQPCLCTSIWQLTDSPSSVDSGDSNSVEVGVKFRADASGTIEAVRFFKASTNTGTHIGHIWSSTGVLLGSVTFTNENASGWQEAMFSPPVTVSANTVYIASYFAPVGHYSADIQYFAPSGVDDPPLHALADGVSGPDGVYAYGGGPIFPNSGINATNYWVDVVFAPSPPHNISGTITGAGGEGTLVTLSGGSTLATVADQSGNFSFTNVSDGTYVITPTNTGYAFTTASQTITLNGADVTGVTFGTLPNCMPCDSIWPTTSAPTNADAGDGQSVDVGMKFKSDSDGYIVGLRFFKSAMNDGNHVGSVWSDSGEELGSVTFEGESRFGWQQAVFSNPIPISANTTYVATYLAPVGHYAGDNNYFASGGIDNIPLHALADGSDGPNGAYNYGTTVLFPTFGYLGSNYWVDVLFTPTGPTHAITGTISGAGGPNATVSLSGASSTTVTADANGNFAFGGLADGTYWITPSQTGYAFNPGGQAIVISGADVNAVNFATIQNCPCKTIWPSSAAPAISDSGDPASINVGVKFRADNDGYIVGLRFYKAPLNTGIHIGSLWSDTGTQLATVMFTGESTSGWQQVLFDTAVPVSANTTYVASYLAPAGHYAGDLNFFTSNGVDNPPLHALMDGVDGGNGVFAYSSATVFPNQSNQAANYWVDVIYASTASYSIAGTVGGPGGPGVTVTLDGASATTITADASGNYSFGGLTNGTYTVTPVSTIYDFSPPSQSVTVNNGHVLNVNFTSGFGISGTITGSGGPGATVSLTGPSNATVIADGSGNYSFTGLPNGIYSVAVNNSSYTFTPGAQSATVNGASVTALNFNSLLLLTITGHIGSPGGPGATVLLTGASTTSTTADASGNYEFTALASGSYTVAPTNAGFVFSPASQPVTLNGANATANFTSAVATYSISGTISGPGGANATVSLTGTSVATTTADVSGNYSFSGLLNGTYIVTPGNPGYVFTPASMNVVISSTSYAGLNFATVSGCPTCNTVWPASAVPVVTDGGDPTSMELGVKIRADSDGYITGLRFYKAPANTGTHVAHVWSSTGTLLGMATVTGESGAGWQQMIFGTPIPVVANTTYVASYLAPSGHYSADANFFAASGVDNAPLHVPANGVDGANGVFLATTTGGFPTSTNQSTNYWVDVVYSNTQGYSIVGTISGPGGSGATVNLTGAATASTTADASGNFSFNNLSNGSYTVTPSNSGNTFTPANQAITINSAHAMSVNFTSASATFSLSGTIGGPGGPGATVSLTGTSTATTTANGSGNYTFTSVINGSYSVTPSNGSYVFSPSSQSSTVNGANVSGVNFISLTVASVTVNPTSVLGGSSSTGTVTLSAPAPAGGAVVALSSSNTAAAQVPATITVGAGATTATFNVTCPPVAANTSLTISATLGTVQTASLTVTAPVLKSVSLNPAAVGGGSTSTGTVTLNGPAPPAGAVVTLSGSNTAAAQVPATVTVAANATTATFAVTTSPVSASTSITISANYGGTQTASLIVAPGLSTVTLSPSSVNGGTSSTGTVTLTGPAPSGGAVVTLTSSNTSAAQVPASVTVAAGATKATFTITTSAVGSNASVTISGTYGVTKTATLTVTAAALTSVSLSPSSVIGGTSSTGTVTLTGPAPSGGAVVTLTSSNTTAAQVPASVTVAAGATKATFTITTSAVGSNASVTISGTYGVTKTATLTVTAAALTPVSLSPSSVIGGTSSTGTVTLTGPAPSGGAVVTLTSSNTSAAQVPASVTVTAGATKATFTITTSAVGSNASVTISGTYGVTKTATLTVTAAALTSVTRSPTSVIGGTSSTGTVTLTGPAPSGGAVVTLTSSNTTAAQVPASMTVAAGATTATFTITTSAVASNASVTISGTYGVTKTTTLTVTAATLTSVSLSPASVNGGTSSTGTVTLTGPAPSGGAVVTLTSSNTSVATVLASVTVPAGSTTATFTVTTKAVTTSKSVTISATKGGTLTATLTVTPP